jgi:hypothetical protein
MPIVRSIVKVPFVNAHCEDLFCEALVRLIVNIFFGWSIPGTSLARPMVNISCVRPKIQMSLVSSIFKILV